MALLTKEIRDRMLANGKHQRLNENFDPMPVVKIFGGGACTWLLTELDPDDNDIAFGLCDLGQGFPELGSVRISELEALRFPPMRLPAERDLYFKPKVGIGRYAAWARRAGRIVYE